MGERAVKGVAQAGNPPIPTLAVASGHRVLIFRNMRPSMQYRLPPIGDRRHGSEGFGRSELRYVICSDICVHVCVSMVHVIIYYAYVSILCIITCRFT